MFHDDSLDNHTFRVSALEIGQHDVVRRRAPMSERGRVTLPATVTGSADAPIVGIDVASMAKRALANRATRKSRRCSQKGLGGLFKKP